MDDARPEQEVDEMLNSLHEGLRTIEAAMSTLLDDMAADNVELLAGLETALADAEAALTFD